MITRLITYVRTARKTESDPLFFLSVIHVGLSEQMETFYLDMAH